MQLQQASDGAAPEAAPDVQSSTAAGRSGRGSRAVDDFLALAPDEVAAACCPPHHIAWFPASIAARLGTACPHPFPATCSDHDARCSLQPTLLGSSVLTFDLTAHPLLAVCTSVLAD